MSRQELTKLTIQQLKKVCDAVNISYEKKKKEEIVDILDNTFNKPADLLTAKLKQLKQPIVKPIEKKSIEKPIEQPYKIISTIGVEGKDGKVYLVIFRGNKYALKKFKQSKSVDSLKKEIALLERVSNEGIAPKVVNYNLKDKYIIMDLLEKSLFDVLKLTKGIMSIYQQKQFVKLNQKMDQLGIYHGDPSPLNFLFDKNNDLKVIDFGFSEYVDKKFIEKHKTKTPNQKFMLLGFILKMKSLGVDVDNNYNYIKNYIDKSDLEKCSIKIKTKQD